MSGDLWVARGCWSPLQMAHGTCSTQWIKLSKSVMDSRESSQRPFRKQDQYGSINEPVMGRQDERRSTMENETADSGLGSGS